MELGRGGRRAPALVLDTARGLDAACSARGVLPEGSYADTAAAMPLRCLRSGQSRGTRRTPLPPGRRGRPGVALGEGGRARPGISGGGRLPGSAGSRVRSVSGGRQRRESRRGAAGTGGRKDPAHPVVRAPCPRNGAHSGALGGVLVAVGVRGGSARGRTDRKDQGACLASPGQRGIPATSWIRCRSRGDPAPPRLPRRSGAGADRHAPGCERAIRGSRGGGTSVLPRLASFAGRDTRRVSTDPHRVECGSRPGRPDVRPRGERDGRPNRLP